jgi:ABC-type nitrate/sulfonate/bicarbonate transport system permease component
LVAAELVAAQQGLGYMIMDALPSSSEGRLCGLIVIGLIGFLLG